MSITFMPAGNNEYCVANGLVTTVEYQCQCVGYPNNGVCYDCSGTGVVKFNRYPFEINLANGNARSVQEMFKMPGDYCGSCNPQVILDGIEFVKSIRMAGHDPLVSETEVSGDDGGITVIVCGRTPDRVDRYLEAFYEIAMEAARRKVDVVWG